MQGLDIGRPIAPFHPNATQTLPSIEGAIALSSLGRIYVAPVEAILGYQIEVFKFMAKRFESDLQLIEDSYSPDHANDVFDVWCSYWQDSFLDYLKEGARLAEVGSLLAKKTAARLRKDEHLWVDHIATQTTI